MALTKVQGLVTHYRALGRGRAIICLHGWGGSAESFHEVASLLARDYRVIALDLPGFGQTDAPLEAWRLDAYVAFLFEFIHHLALSKVVLCGHSFGGRVALRFAAAYPNLVSHLLLLAAAGIKHEKSPEEKAANFLARIGKRFFSFVPLKNVSDPARWLFYKMIRRNDYYQASTMMRETMKLVIEEDLTPTLSLVTTPTLIIWGEKDDYVPLTDAHLMQRRIKKSRLEVIKGANHYLPKKYPKETAMLIRKFLR